MNRLSLVSLALVAGFCAASARAAIVDVSFTGTVQSQTGTSFAPD